MLNVISFSQVAETQCIIWARINSASTGIAQHQLGIHKADTHNFSSITALLKKTQTLATFLKKLLWEFWFKKLEENSFCELPVVCDLSSCRPSWESHTPLQKSPEPNAMCKNFPGNEAQVRKQQKSEHLWVQGSLVDSCSFCPNYTVVFNSWKSNRKTVFKAFFFSEKKGNLSSNINYYIMS